MNAAAASFSLRVSCLTCSCELEFDDRQLCGTIVACPQCGGMVSVPDPDATPSATSAAVAGAEVVSVADRVEISPQELRIRRAVVGVFGSLVAILVLLTLYAVFVGFPEPGPEPANVETLPNVADVVAAPVAPNVAPVEPAAPAEPPQDVHAATESPAGDATDSAMDDAAENVAVHDDTAAPPTLDDADASADTRDRFLELMRQTSIAPSIPDNTDEIVRRLDTQVAALNAQGVAAVELARTLAEVACVSITIEPSLAEESVSVAIADPVSVGDALRKIAAMQGAAITIEFNQVSWRRAESSDAGETRWDVSDLASSLDLVAMINVLVPLESVRRDGNELVVFGTVRLCSDAEKILEMLRVVQNLPQRTRRTPANLAAESFGWDAIQQPLSCDVFRPMPLETFLKRLEDRTSIRFLIDHAALGRSGVPVHTLTGTVSAEETTIGGALTEFLKSVDVPVALTYRICGERLIEVTTDDAARQLDAFTIELHRFTLPDTASRKSILAAVTALLDLRETNTENPNAAVWPWPGTDWFFVRAPQPDQRSVRNIVATTVTPANAPDVQAEPDDSTSPDEMEPSPQLPF